MQIIDTYPHAVRTIEHLTIPMSDGTRLAARVWMPEGADVEPVPAILEYLPYRRRDGTRERDETMHPYVAGHGYAVVRVDMRGSGDAEGILRDEYLPQEQDDGVEVLAWLAERPWCDGNLGMIGISWGGFNGLQIAARAPEGLKAIVTIASTDDRYADDVHYMGGCLLLDNLAWASQMYMRNFKPPDPANVRGWRALWRERLEAARFWLEPWLEHQHRDDYWRHGSVCEDYSSIRCAVFAVGGWADAYTNAIPRLLAGLDVPRLGLIGPWGHKYPHFGAPGPAIGFLQEELRWWDHWLKGRDTGIMDEPQLRAWMQESVPPAPGYAERPGRWVGEPAWPSPDVRRVRHTLTPGRIARAGAEAPEGAERGAELRIDSPLGVGFEAGTWCSYGIADLPIDQRVADGASLVFDSEPLEERLEILGAPAVELELAADRPVASVAARLSDVRPDGGVTRVSYGVLNLTHRDSHARPERLEPGRFERVRVVLNDIGQAFPAGHRLRLSLSTDYFPITWPAPERATLTVRTGTSTLELPVREPRREDERVSVAMPSEGSPPMRRTELAPASYLRRATEDQVTGRRALEIVADAGRYRIDDIDLEVSSSVRERYAVQPDDPSSAAGETWATWRLARGDWAVRAETYTRLTADTERFTVHAEVEAFEGDERVFERTTTRQIERDLV